MRRGEKYACALALTAFVFIVLTSSEAPVEVMLAGTCLEPILLRLFNIQEIVFSLSSGCLSGLVIWLFLVDCPYRQKRRAVKASAKMRYRLFREAVSEICLKAAGETWGLDLIERLRDPGDFREYFNEVGVDGQMKRIDAVRTALSGDKSLLDDLITQLHRLAEGGARRARDPYSR